MSHEMEWLILWGLSVVKLIDDSSEEFSENV